MTQSSNTQSSVNISALIILVIAAVLITFLFTRSLYSGTLSTTQSQTNSTQNNCKKNGISEPDTLLRKYVVKKGDSLLLISKNELGDPSRYQEIAVMNGNKYPGLFSGPGMIANNPFLEQGWTLLLPPSWIKNSSGQLDIISGMIFADDQDGIKITTKSSQSGWNGTLKLGDDTINTQNSIFKVGDCITAVRDIRMNKVIKIDLQ